jgi:hypothetical protein
MELLVQNYRRKSVHEEKSRRRSTVKLAHQTNSSVGSTFGKLWLANRKLTNVLTNVVHQLNTRVYSVTDTCNRSSWRVGIDWWCNREGLHCSSAPSHFPHWWKKGH